MSTKKYYFFIFVCFCIFFLSATFVSAAERSLKWDASSGGPTGYSIYYGTTQGSHPTCVEAGNLLERTVTGLEENRTYYFIVRAYNDAGESPDSNELAWNSGSIEEEFGDAVNSSYPGTCEDTYNNRGSHSSNYSANETCLATYTWPANESANTIIIKWDLMAIPDNAVITQANLYLYQYASGGDDNYEITVHRIINKDPYIDNCNWDTSDGANSWSGGSTGGLQDIAEAEDVQIINKTNGEYKSWTVTNMIQDWISQPSSNFGMLLTSDQTENKANADSYRYFVPTNNNDNDSANKKPKLVVRYTIGAGGDTTPPDDATAFNAVPGNSQIALSWINPADTDFKGVMLRFGTDDYPANYQEGILVCKQIGQPGSRDTFLHTQNVQNGTTYYYSAFTYDTSGNYSSTAHASATPQANPNTNQPPVVNITSSLTGEANSVVNFTRTANDSDGQIVASHWDFGDGNGSNNWSATTHTYSNPGRYTVTATATDDDDATGTHSIEVVISSDVTSPLNVRAVAVQ